MYLDRAFGLGLFPSFFT